MSVRGLRLGAADVFYTLFAARSMIPWSARPKASPRVASTDRMAHALNQNKEKLVAAATSMAASCRCKMKNATGCCQLLNAISAKPPRLRTLAMSAFLLAAILRPSGAQPDSSISRAETAPACASYGGWIDGKTGGAIDRGELYRDLVARNAVVLLGESHTDVDHHRVQLQSLAALYGRGKNIVVGFEAFPRRL